MKCPVCIQGTLATTDKGEYRWGHQDNGFKWVIFKCESCGFCPMFRREILIKNGFPGLRPVDPVFYIKKDSLWTSIKKRFKNAIIP